MFSQPIKGLKNPATAHLRKINVIDYQQFVSNLE